MKKFYLFLALLGFILFASARVNAQSTEPGLGLPLLDDGTSATATAGSNYSTQTAVTTYSTVTAVAATMTATSQSAVDDAETGSEVIVLAILSITGGVGIFLIKKFFDFRRYSL